MCPPSPPPHPVTLSYTFKLTLPCLLCAEVDGGWRYQIAVVADPDTNSKVEGKELWKSYLLKGHATVTTTGSGDYKLSVTWDKDLVSETKHAVRSLLDRAGFCQDCYASHF